MIRFIAPLAWSCAAISFAFSLIIPNGYSIGIALLFLLSLVLVFPTRKQRLSLVAADKVLMLLLLVYTLAMFAFLYLDNWQVRELDKPSRFLFAIPVLLLLSALPMKRTAWLFYGVLVGAIGAFVLGYYERFVLGYGRAAGGEHPIMFGDTSMMLGLISSAAAYYFYAQKRYFWVAVSVLAVLAGIGGSVLSASRGGWVALPLIGLFILWQGSDLLGRKLALGVATAGVLLVSVAVAVPQTGIQERIGQAVDEVIRYQHGDVTESSVGMRFDMWKAAVYMFQTAPVLGVGESQTKVVKQELVDQGLISPDVVNFGHSHNEFLDALAEKGIVGFLLLLSLYLIPMRLFIRKLREHHHNWDVKAYAMAGALVPMCYIDFGLSQVMFSHNIGVMMYVFPMIFFWVAVRWAERDADLRGQTP